MKIKSIVCGALLLGTFLAVPSCATSKSASNSNMDERRAVANKTEDVVAKIDGVKSVDAVYTKEKKLRIFVETADGNLSDSMISAIKKAAAEKNGISQSNIVVLIASGSTDEK